MKKPNKHNYKSKGKPKYKSVAKQSFRKNVESVEDSTKFGAGKGVQVGTYNDASWYAKNAKMLADAASYSYNEALGTTFESDKLLPIGLKLPSIMDKVHDVPSRLAVPGLMRLLIAPTIGYSDSSTSPANLAAQNIYSYVRYKNSGAKNYDPADLMIYLLAMDSIYSCWNFLKRAYGLINDYSQYNRYMPQAYFAACSLDFDDFISNIADFRLALNRFAAQIASFCVPGVMTYFVRHSWMFSNVYKDSDNLKAQQYMYVPAYFYKYEEVASQYGGTLTPKRWSSTGVKRTVKEACAYLQELIDAVAFSEDVGVMSGDILKAYGESGLVSISPVDANYVVYPTYVEEVLNQIHNSTIVPSPGEFDSWKITQDPGTGFLIWKPTIVQASLAEQVMLNMPWNSVTPENTMVGSRLTAGGVSIDPNNARIICGSEVVTNRSLYRYEYANGVLYLQNRSIQQNVFNLNIGLKDGDVVDFDKVSGWDMQTLACVTNFDWHPITPVTLRFRRLDGAGNFGATLWATHFILGDISNYTFLDMHNLENMHSTALMSEFNIPAEGSF